ncbi:hypothetical protein [Arthrobacter sp. GMC3]|uniref:hypothetical protein n=1 Tax=Arthrobacter sp. GMC3 TaxID=2058894 RepID=UPI000CE4CCC1|nr:hypothetical protein [Arthrobacter sp. GMC3]
MSTETTTIPAAIEEVQHLNPATGELTAVEAMAVQYANAAAAAQPFLDSMADIKAKLLEALPIGNHAAGPLIVTIKAGAKVLDTKKLEAAYPQAENPLFYKSAFDTTAVKKFVAPAVLEVYTRQNASSVVIK